MHYACNLAMFVWRDGTFQLGKEDRRHETYEDREIEKIRTSTLTV